MREIKKDRKREKEENEVEEVRERERGSEGLLKKGGEREIELRWEVRQRCRIGQIR